MYIIVIKFRENKGCCSTGIQVYCQVSLQSVLYFQRIVDIFCQANSKLSVGHSFPPNLKTNILKTNISKTKSHYKHSYENQLSGKMLIWNLYWNYF